MDPKRFIERIELLQLVEFRENEDLKRSLRIALEYRVMGHIIVRNLTKWTLTNPNYYIKRGKFTSQPVTIKPGSQSQIVTNKTDWSVHGSCGWITWDIETYQVIVMWNIPFDFEPNKLAVGLKQNSNPQPSTWHYTSVYSTPFRDENLVMNVCPNARPRYQKGPLYIQGTMTPNQHSEMEITICPLRREDIAENLEERLNGDYH